MLLILPCPFQSLLHRFSLLLDSFLLAEALLPARALGTSCLSSWRACPSASSALDLLAGMGSIQWGGQTGGRRQPRTPGHRGPAPVVCWALSPPLREPFCHLHAPSCPLLHAHPSHPPSFCRPAFPRSVVRPRDLHSCRAPCLLEVRGRRLHSLLSSLSSFLSGLSVLPTTEISSTYPRAALQRSPPHPTLPLLLLFMLSTGRVSQGWRFSATKSCLTRRRRFFHVGSTEQCRSGKNFQFQG